MTFRTRVLLATTGLLILVVVGILFGMRSVIGGEILQRLAADLDNTSGAVQEDLRAYAVRLLAECHVVAEEPRLKAVINTPDVDDETRADVARELRSAIGWDVLGLADSSGAVRTLVGPRALREAPSLVSDALAKGDASGYWLDGGHLFQGVAVRLEFGAQVVGVLLAGAELNDARATELMRRTNAAVAFFAEDRLVSTSMTGAARTELPSWGARRLASELPLGNERYLTREVSLAEPGVRVAVLRSAEEALGPFRRMQRAVIAIGLFALVLAVAVAVFLSLGWSRPIAQLVDLAHDVKSGNLEVRVAPSGGAELATLGATLNEMVAEIARQRRRDELASFLVHDLKNPLTGVLVNAKLIESSEQLTEDGRESVDGVVSSAETMLSMVMDLLDVGGDTDGTLVPKKAVFDLHELIDQVRRDAVGRAKRRNLEIVAKQEGPRTIRADRNIVRRVLENLLDNAFKYAPEGGRIYLDTLPTDNGRVQVRVRDEGPGVPEAFRTKIFDKFFRLDRDANTYARTSRGLGLVFCRVAIEAHEGRIWVEDNKPKGTSFCFTLPLGT
jgi:two-component system, sensor histidine kinase and response regulator